MLPSSTPPATPMAVWTAPARKPPPPRADIMATSFFVSRCSIRPSVHGGMPFWQDKLFITLAKSASNATDFFQIPTGRVVEVGTQVTV
jgi:K+ transporter